MGKPAYTPYRSVVKESSRQIELEGVVSSYHIGGVLNKAFKNKILLSLNAEIGFMVVMYPTDISGNTDNDLKKSGQVYNEDQMLAIYS